MTRNKSSELVKKKGTKKQKERERNRNRNKHDILSDRNKSAWAETKEKEENKLLKIKIEYYVK